MAHLHRLFLEHDGTADDGGVPHGRGRGWQAAASGEGDPDAQRAGHGLDPQAEPGWQGRAPLILIVEDNRDSAEVLALLLQMAGFEVELALSAYEALEAVRRRQPTLVISDIYMPGLNGFDLATLLREVDGFEHVPLVALSGGNSAIDEHRASRCGFNRYLRKPVNPDSLQALLGHLLDRRRSRHPGYGGPERRSLA
jgi:CheY-like chemotaxis protein